MSKVFTFTVELAQDARADKHIHAHLEELDDLNFVLSRSQIQRLIEEGAILVNEKPIRTKDKLLVGSEVKITLPEPVELEAKPENIPLQILFEDEHLLVLNKQPGLTVHPSETQRSGTLVNALLYHIKDLSGIGGKLRPGIVHRIDKDTSGALVITKTDQAHSGLSKLFACHTIERKYWALAYGSPPWDTPFRFESLLGRSDKDRKKMAITQETGRRAISFFTHLESYGLPSHAPFASLIEAKLQTGRTHQVRVHLNHLNHSILGDTLYGAPTSNQPKWKALPHSVQDLLKKLPGQALHARTLGFKHPITGKELHFEAEPYPEFQNLLTELKKFR